MIFKSLFSGILPWVVLATVASSGAAYYFFKKNIELKAQHKTEIDGLSVAIHVQNDHVNELIEARRIEQESAKRLTELRKARESINTESRIEVAKSNNECAEARFSDVFSVRLDSLFAN